MAKEVTISVGAKTNDAAIKQASVNVLEVFGKALKGLENISGQSAKTVKKELESIQGAFSSKTLTKEAKAHFKELAKSLNALVKVNDVTGEIEVNFKKVHEKIGEAAKKSAELSKHVKKIEEDLPSGSAMGEMVNGLNGLSGEFSSLMEQAKSFGESIKSFASGFKSAGVGLKAAGLAGAIAAIGMAIMSAVKSWIDFRRESKIALMESENRKFEHSLEIQNKKLQTKVELQNMARENAQAELKATQDLVIATAELEAARKRAGAISSSEKNEVENALNKVKNKVQAESLLADIDKKEKEDKQRLENLTTERGLQEKIEDNARQNKETYTPLRDQYKGGSTQDYANQGWWGAVKGAVRKILPIVETAEERQTKFNEYDSKVNAAEKARIKALQEQVKKKKEIEDIEKRLAEGGLYAKQREEIKKKIELLKEEQRIRELEQERERERAKRERENDVEERKRSQEDAQDERDMSESEMYSASSYDKKVDNLDKRIEKYTKRLQEDQGKLKEAETKEIARINAERQKSGQKLITSLSEVGETGLSEDFKSIRGRYEGRIQEGSERLRDLKHQRKELVFRGPETTEAERRQQEIDDRKRENQIADAEEEDRKKSQYSQNAEFQKGIVQAKLARSQSRMAQYEHDLEAAKQEELDRVNAARRARGESAVDKFEGLEAHELSGKFRDTESRLKGLIEGEKSTQRGLNGQIFDYERQGDARMAELRAQQLKGGSRLTAMGLGGGDSPQKETAKNTRLMVGALNKVVTLLNPNEVRFQKNPQAGKWGIL